MQAGLSSHTSSRQTISACMIVRNEEKFLPGCLQSIKNAVDEIIIVDTGSTDRTVEIAQSFGAKVYHYPWQDDFSKARNYSLNHASGEWVLYIDADETLEQADIPLLHSLLNNNSYNAIFVAIYSELPKGCSKHYFTRIFRRGKARFEGIVHEQLIFEGKILQSEIRLYHAGYNLSNEDMDKKHKRTGDLLRKQLEETPDCLFAITNLVRNYKNVNNNEKAIELGERGLKIPVDPTDFPGKQQRQRIFFDLSTALANTNQLDRAEEVSRKALCECPDFLDNLLHLGCILIAKKAYHEAINYLKKFLIIRENERNKPDFNLLPVDSYDSEHKAYYGLGECFRNLGLTEEAEAAYKKAIEMQNGEPAYYTGLAQLYISKNLLSKAENTVSAALRQGISDDSIHMLTGKILSLQGKPDEAIKTLRAAIAKNPGDKNVNTYMLLINLLIQTGQLEEAESAIKSAISLCGTKFG